VRVKGHNPYEHIEPAYLASALDMNAVRLLPIGSVLRGVNRVSCRRPAKETKGEA
jgi:hypothetical protein